jgi:hypothetical protein
MQRTHRRSRMLLAAGLGATFAAASLVGFAGAQQQKSPPVVRFRRSRASPRRGRR